MSAQHSPRPSGPVADRRPLVSIGLPVRNGERYLRQSLDALLAQGHGRLELLVSDNASTDGTQSICREYAVRDPRVSYHRNPVNVGMIRNFNDLFGRASGRYFMWAGDHDLWDPDLLSSCVRVMEREPDVVLCYPLADWIGADGEKLGQIATRLDTRGMEKAARLHLAIWGPEFPYQIYGLIRSDALRRTGMFVDAIGTDNILLTELSLLGAFACVPRVLFHVRRMPGFGGFRKYIEGLGRPVNWWSGLFLFWRMIWHHLAVIRRQTNSAAGCLALQSSAFIALLIRHHWVYRGLTAARNEVSDATRAE